MNSAVLEEDIQLFAERFPLFNELKEQSFLITGATGHIGSIMAKCLCRLSKYRQLNITISACVRDLEKAKKLFESYPEIHLLESSLDDLSSTDLCGINYVIHLAAPTASTFYVSHPVETMQSIIGGTDSVLQFAKRNRINQVLYVSSMEVYGALPDGILANDNIMGSIDPSNARSSYPLAKRTAEALCLNYGNEYGLDVRIARLSQTFGAGINNSENRVFAQFAKSIINNKDIVLLTPGDSAHCYCYTTDSISAILYILIKGAPSTIYNVGNKNTYCSIREMAQQICSAFHSLSRVIINVDSKAPYPPSSRLNLDTSRIEALGWKPEYGLEEMYKRLIRYLCPSFPLSAS